MGSLALGACAAAMAACGPVATQQLTPGQLESVRRGADRMDVPAEGVTVPLFGPPELPLVEVMLNGVGPFRFLVDLGSNVVILRRSVADSAGLEVILDRERSDILRARELTIGAARFHDVWMGGYDELDVDGVIGYNLLMGTGFALDYVGRTFELGGPDRRATTGSESLPYEVVDRLPFLRARVGERDILLNLDTGAANHVVFPLSMADSLPLEGPLSPGPILYNNQTGSTRNFVARVAGDITFGGVVIERPVALFDPAVEDAWLGSAILTGSRLELDTERQVLHLAHEKALVSPPYRTLGLGLGPPDPATGLRPVTDVIPGTPAETGHLVRVGDLVESVEGVPAADLDAARRRALAAAHDSVEIRLVRDGRAERLTLRVASLPA